MCAPYEVILYNRYNSEAGTAKTHVGGETRSLRHLLRVPTVHRVCLAGNFYVQRRLASEACLELAVMGSSDLVGRGVAGTAARRRVPFTDGDVLAVHVRFLWYRWRRTSGVERIPTCWRGIRRHLEYIRCFHPGVDGVHCVYARLCLIEAAHASTAPATSGQALHSITTELFAEPRQHVTIDRNSVMQLRRI